MVSSIYRARRMEKLVEIFLLIFLFITFTILINVVEMIFGNWSKRF